MTRPDRQDGAGARRVLQLVGPTQRLHAAWSQAHAEWGDGSHEDGFGLRPSDDVVTPTGFATWLARLAAESDPEQTTARGRHRCTYRWIVEDDRVLGGIVLRQGDDDLVSWAGHIGYGVRPSARRRGVATWALREMSAVARDHGLGRVLAVCAVDNTASARVIERSGGVLEGIGETPFGPARRYWIDLRPAGPRAVAVP